MIFNNESTDAFKKIIERYNKHISKRKEPTDIFTRANLLLNKDKFKDKMVIDFSEDEVVYKGVTYKKQKGFNYAETENNSKNHIGNKNYIIKNRRSSNKNINIQENFNTISSNNENFKESPTRKQIKIFDTEENEDEELEETLDNIINTISSNFDRKLGSNKDLNCLNVKENIHNNSNEENIKHVKKLSKYHNPLDSRVKNKSLIIKEEDILPMICQAKSHTILKNEISQNLNNLNNNQNKNQIKITEKDKIKNYLINKGEQDLGLIGTFYSAKSKKFKSISQSQKSIFTRNSQPIINYNSKDTKESTISILNTKHNTNANSNNFGTLCPSFHLSSTPVKTIKTIKSHMSSPIKSIDKKFEMNINNLMDNEIMKNLLNKISKQMIVDKALKLATDVQKILIEDSKINSEKFEIYKNYSDELRKRYLYIINNKFV